MDQTRPREGTSADKTFIPIGQSKQSLLANPYLGSESVATSHSGSDAGAAAAAAAVASPGMPTYQQNPGGIEVVHESHGLHPSWAQSQNVSSSQVNSTGEEKIAVVSPYTVAASTWPASNSQTAWNSTAGLIPVKEKRIWGLRPTTLTNNTTTTNAPSNPSDGRNPKICFDTTTPPAARSQYGTTRADCPRSGDKRYTVPGTNLTFTRTCGVDYKDNDLGRFPTATMEDCLALCAQLNIYPSSGQGLCEGVTWMFGGTQGEGSSYCYPKYKVDAKGPDRTDVESAVLITGSGA
ncbi:hypothetical protein PpBr36_02579 [Pyricularia pennisetigena]|uniref:hypothetical protein n=1 Tax=Pyricularia pennisetigena TaxID=1578925 RepID=UPI001154829A|nr:hypothetical protein PpBr36_02579 [Pyricularia pennisetigena]TLS31546.1 hypothetical protein PpBr36_02579 [Pyricularia pennisetigena]